MRGNVISSRGRNRVGKKNAETELLKRKLKTETEVGIKRRNGDKTLKWG